VQQWVKSIQVVEKKESLERRLRLVIIVETVAVTNPGSCGLPKNQWLLSSPLADIVAKWGIHYRFIVSFGTTRLRGRLPTCILWARDATL
jgi:hypothetical protein